MHMGKCDKLSLSAVEWRIPVGRAERAGDRKGKREMQVQTRMLTREGKKRTTEREKTGERMREPKKREEKRKAEETREGMERKRAGKARGGGSCDDDHSSNSRKREERGRRDGTGGRRAGAPRKKRKGCVCAKCCLNRRSARERE
jgi:hypothetical protein